jgi:uncharacterized membrane protein YkvA (DUF1232 family)
MHTITVATSSRISLWMKVLHSAKAAGRNCVEKVLRLHYAAQSPEAPLWARTVIYGALAYFFLPVDAIPDLLPGVGYSDDFLTLSAAVVTVASCINSHVKQQARQQLENWFDKE